MSEFWIGSFKIAEMKDSMLECDKEQVYLDQKGKVLKQEYLKIIYEFFSL